MRLSAFRFPSFFLRFFPSSLPDLIRQSMRQRSPFRISERLSKLHLGMDHRVKPGGDEGYVVTFCKTRARMRRENDEACLTSSC
jgi:hypothetical protein